jgi:hypothetical protein
MVSIIFFVSPLFFVSKMILQKSSRNPINSTQEEKNQRRKLKEIINFLLQLFFFPLVSTKTKIKKEKK